MLRIIQSKGGAKNYFTKSDYLSESQELSGKWYGKAAQMLGLEGEVGKQEFDRLCDNEHPDTGEKLTLRNRDGRTIGYDFNFHVPKGISIAYEIMGDERILDAFNQAVDETMHEIEHDAATRVRKHGGNINRTVGNLAWAKFVHKTARPVDGVPDPHLHAHCFVQNVVFDEKENSWKAGQFRDIKRDARYFEAAYHARLAANVKQLGYHIERRGKSWDVAQVPEPIAAMFSRRTKEIEAKAAEKEKELAEENKTLSVKQKAELGAKSRKSKQTDLSMSDLRQVWRERLSDDDAASIGMPSQAPRSVEVDRSVQAMKHATEHCFERSSVIPKRQLLAEALRFGVGDVSVDGVAQQLDDQDVIVRKLANRDMATTHQVLAEERAMLDFVKAGRSSQLPLVNEWKPKRKWLNSDQHHAVKSLLESKDRVVVIRGGAGTGKTSLMSEAVEAIEKEGTSVFTFAPSAEASRGVLASEGFNATTVAELLVSEKLQGEVAGSVLWIDEAGLLSSKDLKQVLDIAKANGNRVVLSGDPKQHKSVERGDVLQMLEDEKAVKPIVVEKIERQKGVYRRAVEHLSVGNTEKGIDELNVLGWIKSIADGKERMQTLAESYADEVAEKKSTLVVAPTHAEAAQATVAIRTELKLRELIGSNEHQFKQYKPVHLTTAEKADPAMFSQGNVLVFHQNIPGIKRGATRKATPEVLAKAIQHPDRFSVFTEADVGFARGDKLRVTRSGKTLDGEHRIYNGNVFDIKDFDQDGHFVLQNGWKIDKDFGHVSLGYVSTSHSSQGKTVDHVFVVESSTSFPAAGKEQLYVSVSRGRKKATILTDDLDEFRQAVSRGNERMTAIGMTSRSSDPRKLKARRQRIFKEIGHERDRQQARKTEVSRG